MIKYEFTSAQNYKLLTIVRRNLINRCTKPNHQAFLNYGARGITVCEEWLNRASGKESFIRWAMSNGYEQGLEIDRKDNDLGYSPENCHFITAKENCRNRRSSRLYSINGENLCVSAIVELYGKDIPKTVMFRRLDKGWDPIKACQEPTRNKTKFNITVLGENFSSLSAAIRSYSVIGDSAIQLRLEKGWNLENAILLPPLSKKVTKRLNEEGWNPATPPFPGMEQ